ncbi:hypothetical protein EIN_333980 [Entamoeba invadens IP1]|uniref:MD-2-related lipid-recognition domain-containing protein n=1 Tax=Entamoeba invadens IP1 TaxID=370355 RepID=A0A0A1UB69_ENTIV|nr:hypothetical protein EIN_333980 [Entamoeba invadens IP1]ELP92431.1 hypothetical protein EIN_333980 [Entamoeba invadens IP1]|eukprot:XP_004259202.1 hypothetical protein EIN_333980 [Entamoeba invadens IP1]
MFFIALLLAYCYADPGIINMTFCEDKTVNLDFNVTVVEFEKPAEREFTNYTIVFEILQPHDHVVLKWHVEYYWGSLFIASYQYEDAYVCDTIVGGCTTKGLKRLRVTGKVEEAVTLPGWYLLVLEMTNFELYHSCFHGWVYLY